MPGLEQGTADICEEQAFAGNYKNDKNVPNQAGYADVKNLGRTSHTWFLDSVKFLEILQRFTVT